MASTGDQQWLPASRLVEGRFPALFSRGVSSWKISFHLMGVAGCVVVAGLVFGWPYFLLACVLFPVAWARWQVEAHTPLQTLAGALLAAIVTGSVFWLFHLV
jgi:membrane-associated phospholipid phosphatase